MSRLHRRDGIQALGLRFGNGSIDAERLHLCRRPSLEVAAHPLALSLERAQSLQQPGHRHG